MLKKKAPGAAAAAEPASPTGLGDPQSPSPPASKFARHSNGGGPPSLLLSTRSLPSLFSTDCPISPTSMTDQPKNPPCFSPKNGIRSEAAGLAGVLVAGEADGGYLKNGRVLLGMRLRVQLPPPPVGKVGPGDLPGSPIEFGVKNRDAQLALLSPVQRSPLSSAARAARRSEVGELAEDWTRFLCSYNCNCKLSSPSCDRHLQNERPRCAELLFRNYCSENTVAKHCAQIYCSDQSPPFNPKTNGHCCVQSLSCSRNSNCI